MTDHHAVIPTRNLPGADLSSLPVGEKAVLELVALRLLCAVAQPYTFAETAVVVECAGAEFAAKGRTVKQLGWRALDVAYRAGLKNAEPDKEIEDKALPELSEGQTLPLSGVEVKEGKTTPPKHFTEDTLLSAMETAGKDDMPEDAERKGLGTPATRAGILEKLVSTGFLERKKSKKTLQLLPSHDAVSLITVLPEQLQSPLLTAEWEYRLGEIERGELAPEDFMDGISTILQELVRTYQVIKGTEYLFTPPREVVGKCPRCGGEVAEMQKGFFCQTESCKFAIWKNNKWWELKRKQPTKAIVTALLKDGRAHVTGLYSEKTGKTYDATVVLEDGRYLIMANGTRAFAIPAQPESHIKTAEMSTEQNYNMIDGMMNNAPSMEELEARAKAGEQISLLDVAEAAKAEAKKPKQTQKTTQKQKKPSIRAQLAAAKEEQKKRPPAREKSKEMEV